MKRAIMAALLAVTVLSANPMQSQAAGNTVLYGSSNSDNSTGMGDYSYIPGKGYCDSQGYIIDASVYFTTHIVDLPGTLKLINNQWYYYETRVGNRTGNGTFYQTKTGFVAYGNQIFYVVNGKLATQERGIVQSHDLMCYLSEGRVNQTISGIFDYMGGHYYFVSGRLYKGDTTVFSNGKYYRVKNGVVVGEV